LPSGMEPPQSSRWVPRSQLSSPPLHHTLSWWTSCICPLTQVRPSPLKRCWNTSTGCWQRPLSSSQHHYAWYATRWPLTWPLSISTSPTRLVGRRPKRSSTIPCRWGGRFLISLWPRLTLALHCVSAAGSGATLPWHVGPYKPSVPCVWDCMGESTITLSLVAARGMPRQTPLLPPRLKACCAHTPLTV